jgi:hypothetical protein
LGAKHTLIIDVEGVVHHYPHELGSSSRAAVIQETMIPVCQGKGSAGPRSGNSQASTLLGVHACRIYGERLMVPDGVIAGEWFDEGRGSILVTQHKNHGSIVAPMGRYGC